MRRDFEPTLAQMNAICRRKDEVADNIRDDIHEAWAISWLAVQAQDSGRSDFCHKTNSEALRTVLERVLSLTETAKGRLDGPHSGARHAVMNNPEKVP